jgi:DNA-binding transcriptional MocR family regulator
MRANPPYLSLVAAIASDVAEGRLRAGDALPSHRELARHLGLSPGTVAKAYAEARRRGLVEGSRRAGTRVRYIGGLDRMLSSAYPINFASSQPNPSIGPDLTAALTLVRRRQADLMRYAPPEGYPRHRAAGQSWLAMIDVQGPELDVLPTSGAQHGVSMAIGTLLDTGDTIAAGSLCYPGLMAAAQFHGIQVASVPHDELGLAPEVLDSLCRRRKIRAVYCMPSAANPTGHTMPLNRKQTLATVAAEHDLIVIEDETHRPYVNRPAQAIVTLAPERTVLLTSLSKVLMGGVRVGFAALSPELGKRLRRSIQADVLATSALDLELVTALIENGEAARVIGRRYAEAERRKEIAARLIGDAVAALPRRDGPYLWLEMPSSMSSEALTGMAESRGVAVTPASVFATGTDHGDGLRVALSAPVSDADVERGLKLLCEIFVPGKSRGSPSTWAAHY